MKCSLNIEAKAFYTSVVSIVFDGTKGGECLTGAEGSKQFADTLSQMEGLEAGCTLSVIVPQPVQRMWRS